jgi:hypothetical protein
MDSPSKLISPELVLIDDALKEPARRLLPEPGDCLAPRPPEPSPPGRVRTAVASRPSISVMVAALLAAGLIGTPARDWLPFGKATGPAQPAAGSANLSLPSTSGGPAATPTVLELRWREARNAAFYDLVVLRTGSRAVRLRVTGNRVRSAAVIERAGSRLAPGSYMWYVLPGFEDGGRTRLGDVLAIGLLSVPP